MSVTTAEFLIWVPA